MGIYKGHLENTIDGTRTPEPIPLVEDSNTTSIITNTAKTNFIITQDGAYKINATLAWGTSSVTYSGEFSFYINDYRWGSPPIDNYVFSPNIVAGTFDLELYGVNSDITKPQSANYGTASSNSWINLKAGDVISFRFNRRYAISTAVLFGKNSVPNNDMYCFFTIEDDIQPPEEPPTQAPANPRSLKMYSSLVAYDVYEYDVDVTGEFSCELLTQIKYSDLDTRNSNQGTLSMDFEAGSYEVNLKPRKIFKRLANQGNIFFIRRIYEVHGYNNHIPLFPLEQYENIDKQSGNYFRIVLTDFNGIISRGIVGNNQNASVVRTTNTDTDTGETSYSWSYGENRNKFITSPDNTLTEAITNLFVRTLKTPYRVDNTKTPYVVDNNRKFYGLEFLDASVFDVIEEKKSVAIDMTTTIADAFKIMLSEFNQTNFQPWLSFDGNYFKLSFYKNNEIVFDIQKNKSKILGYTSGINKTDTITDTYGLGENTTISRIKSKEMSTSLNTNIRPFEEVEDFGTKVGTNQEYLDNLTRKKNRSNKYGYTSTIIFDANFFVGHVTAKVGDILTIKNGSVVTNQRIKSITEIMDRNGVVFSFDLE